MTTELISYTDYKALPLDERSKHKDKHKILETERLRKSADIQLAKAVRLDILEFAENEIIPLIIDCNEKLIKNSKYKKLKLDTTDTKKVKNKAFYITLDLFLLHDKRLLGNQTLDFIGALFNVTREAIRLNEETALVKLNKNSKELALYLDI